MNDTENNEQEPETENPSSGSNDTSGESSDNAAPRPVDPPIIVQDSGTGNP